MAERYTAKCRVCGATGNIGPGWCKLLLFDDDYNKTTEWLCPKHYKEFVDSGGEVIPAKGGKKSTARKRGAKASSSGSKFSRT